MKRALVLLISIPTLFVVACDAPTTGPELDPGYGTPEALEAAGPGNDVVGGPFGPFPIEYPFMPYPDGYQFKNYGGAADWMLFLETFGNQVNVWSIFDREYYNNTYVHKFGNGMCYGFGVTAAMFYRGSYGPHPSEFQRGATTPFPIPQLSRGVGDAALDEAIEHHISKYYYFQYSPQIKDHRIGFYGPDYAEEIISAVEASQENDWDDLWVLGFLGPWGGHAVNILNVQRTDDGAVFTVYDNNAPFNETTNSPGFRIFSIDAEGYHYGTRQIDRAGVFPTLPQERAHIDKWWGGVGLGELQPWMSRIMYPGAFVIHTDELKRRVGHTASGILDEIPDAVRIRSLTGALDPDWIEPIEYYLPPGAYTVELINPTTGDLGYRMFAGDALFSLETSGLEPATVEVSLQPDGGVFSFVARTAVQGIQLGVAKTLGVEEERALGLTGLPFPVDGALRINSTDGGSGFHVEFEGTEMALGDLILTEASPAGVLSLPLLGIQLMDGASLTVEPWDWGRLTETPVFGRRLMPDGRVLLTAYNASAMGLEDLLVDLVTRGAIANRGIANSIWKMWENAPPKALMNHLESLVAEGALSQATSDLILATAEAAAAGGTSQGRFIR